MQPRHGHYFFHTNHIARHINPTHTHTHIKQRSYNKWKRHSKKLFCTTIQFFTALKKLFSNLAASTGNYLSKLHLHFSKSKSKQLYRNNNTKRLICYENRRADRRTTRMQDSFTPYKYLTNPWVSIRTVSVDDSDGGNGTSWILWIPR